MRNMSFSALCLALLVAAAMGLATTGAADAQSIMKQCGDEWKAAKANNTTNGQTWQEFLKSCRAQKAAAAPAAAPMQTAARPTGAGHFSTDSEAKARCPSDNAAWVNTTSRAYH